MVIAGTRFLGRTSYLAIGLSMIVLSGGISASGPSASGLEYSDEALKDLPPLGTPRGQYVAYCGNCHGLAGLGDGPIAEFMSVKPTDLTRMAEQNGGVFPEREMRDMIDGRQSSRTNIRAHGYKEMPVWGAIFSALHYGGDAEVTRHVDGVIEYLKEIQQP